MRISVMVASICLYLGIIAIVLLIPTYYGLTLDAERLVAELEEKQRTVPPPDSDISSKVDRISREVMASQVASSTNYGAESVELLHNISEHRVPGIGVSSLTYTSMGKGKEKEVLVLSGKADTRDALIAFRDGLGKDKRYAQVSLSSALLIKRVDIAYSMELTLQPK